MVKNRDRFFRLFLSGWSLCVTWAEGCPAFDFAAVRHVISRDLIWDTELGLYSGGKFRFEVTGDELAELEREPRFLGYFRELREAIAARPDEQQEDDVNSSKRKVDCGCCAVM